MIVMDTERLRNERKMQYVRKVGVKLPLTKGWVDAHESLHVDAKPAEKGPRTQMNKLALANAPQDCNILLLGETGVGKSTFINGLINYSSFATLADAEQGKPVSLIPSRFTYMDDDYQAHNVIFGEDSNEVVETGQSATQMPRTYTFSEGNVRLNIIDTPGIGDTRGLEQDRKNVQYILQHIANFEYIHGICILLTPNNARLTVMFRFCIRELLRQLHPDACKNMLICFTNSRATLFKPGDTLKALKALLTEDNSSNLISLTNDNMFCFDNEAVRYLMAIHNGIQISSSERMNFETSWNKSCQESARLIERVASLVPHRVKYTVSLNEARSDIMALSRPIVEVCKVLQLNIDLSTQKMAELKAIKVNEEKSGALAAHLYIPTIQLVATALKTPQVVCAAPSCIRVNAAVPEFKLIEYRTVCCDDCDTETNKNHIGSSALQHCQAMQPGGTWCNKCRCPWNNHMQITYTIRYDVKQVGDERIKQMLSNKVDKLAKPKAVRRQLELLQEHITKVDHDLDEMLKLSAQFTRFLRSSSIVTFRDTLIEFFDHVVRSEKERCHDGGVSKRVGDLIRMQQRYTEELSSEGSTPDAECVQKAIMSLRSLSVAGPMLTEMMEDVQNAETVPSIPIELNQSQGKENVIIKVFKKIAGLFRS